MKTFGLDIGTTSLKMVEVSREGDKFKLVSMGVSPSPFPGIKSESQPDLVNLSTAIKKLHQESRISTKKGVASIPESQVFNRLIELPQMNDNELSQAIPWEAEQFVPMPLNEVTLDWQVLSRSQAGKVEQKIKVFLVAAPTILVEKYTQVLEMAGLEVAAIETEMIAASRALVLPSAPTTLLVNLGARSTDLAVVSKGQMVLSRSHPTAGEALTRAISTALAMEVRQAEEYKIAYGLEEKELEGKVKRAISPVFDLIVSEIKKVLAFWQEKENEAITRLILTGGTANLPQGGTFLTEKLGLEVQIANPFSQMVVNPKALENLRGKASLFSCAVGLAEKEV